MAGDAHTRTRGEEEPRRFGRVRRGESGGRGERGERGSRGGGEVGAERAWTTLGEVAAPSSVGESGGRDG